MILVKFGRGECNSCIYYFNNFTKIFIYYFISYICLGLFLVILPLPVGVGELCVCVCGGGSDGEVSVCACVFQSKTAGTCLQVGCVEAALMLRVDKH